ncbi:hypothetical protein Q9Q94_00705 [Uliginosibacterium sp. 31-16]|uniref:hypothetical protein n=1 Tax=Uliginosibacterium sp. 31-16 TaxID=3068315 RepID=UPI00273DA952|nr:hypothetical protein [Uliginosibacterium sp. 31-16]MDP5238027.1 hypothetical protein [Uliginosibacterium sp. 31-16]
MKTCEESLEILDSYVRETEGLFKRITSYVEKPKLVTFDGGVKFDHESKNSVLACYLKLARVISGLNAMKLFIKNSYFQEAGVLCRTIIDFCDEISFVLDASTESDITAARCFLKDFYQEVSTEQSKGRELNKREHGVGRKKMYAAAGRTFQKYGVGDTHTLQQTGLFRNDLFSNFVHGAYPVVTEMYSLTGEIGLRGSMEKSLLPQWVDQFNLITHKVLIAATRLALEVNQFPLGEAAKLLTREFEAQQDDLWCVS